MTRHLILLSILLFLQGQAFTQDQVWKKSVEDGIDYIYIKRISGGDPVHIHMLIVNLNNDKIDIKPELAGGRVGNLERTSNIALDSNAIAAINGSFFITKKKLHLPIGNMIIDGRLVNKSILNRTAMGFTKDKKMIFGMPKVDGYIINKSNRKSVKIWGLNRPRKQDETILYTKEFGISTGTNQWGKEIVVDRNLKVVSKSVGSSEIPDGGYVISLHGWSRDFYKNIKVGDKLELKYIFTDGWQDVVNGITGGPLLISDGKIVVQESILREKLRGDLLPRNSRTAVGIRKNNELILAVIDKRSNLSSGATYDELAQIMQEQGAQYAMGLDGGGTSTMYISGRIVNYPLDYAERPVSNALVVKYRGWDLSDRFVSGNIFWSSISKLTTNAFNRIVMEKSELTPTTYVSKPEDYGLYGLQQIYMSLVKPLIPEGTFEISNEVMTYRPASFESEEDLSVFSHGRSSSPLPK